MINYNVIGDNPYNSIVKHNIATQFMLHTEIGILKAYDSYRSVSVFSKELNFGPGLSLRKATGDWVYYSTFLDDNYKQFYEPIYTTSGDLYNYIDIENHHGDTILLYYKKDGKLKVVGTKTGKTYFNGDILSSRDVPEISNYVEHIGDFEEKKRLLLIYIITG